MLVAGAMFSACKEDGDEPEIFNGTEWYPVRTVGEYQVWEGDKISYDLPVNANGVATLYYEQNGEQKEWLFVFPARYKFFMKNGENVYTVFYRSRPEFAHEFGPWRYYIEGNYIFLEELNYSSSEYVKDIVDFLPKPLTIFSSDSIRIGNAYYKKR